MYPRKLPSGNWRVEVKHRGARRSVTRPTKREAVEAAAALLLRLSGESGAVWQRPTVAEAVAERLRTASGWAPTMADQYRIAAARIPARLAGVHLEQVTVPMVERAYAELAAGGVSAHSVRRVHELLRGVFAEAVRVGALGSSPMPAVRPPAKPERQVRPPTPAQVRRLLDTATGPMLVAVTVAAHTGLRRGELVALRWDAVDLAAGRVSIVRSHAYTREAGVHERPTKTGQRGQRTVSIGADVVELLRSWHAAQCEQALGHGLGRPVHVIADDAGVTPWRPDRLTHEFDALRVEARVTLVRLHDLRHYVATQLLSAGVPVGRVSAMLGHASSSTTERIYRHWIPGEDADLADMIGRITRG